jgi:hypothetical protein
MLRPFEKIPSGFMRVSTKHIVSISLLLSAVFFCTGCPNRPDKPEKMNMLIAHEIKKLEGFEDDYYTAYDTNSFETARRLRNRIVGEVKNLIDSNYFDFEIRLSQRRANENILFDSLETGTAVATGIAKGVRVKDILAIALTGTKAFRRSFDQNIFKDKSTDAIISKMRQGRAEIGTILDSRTEASVEVYPLKKAYNDLISYFYAGTLQNALQSLVQDAGEAASKAEAEAKAAEEVRIASEAEFDKSKLIRLKITQLSRDLRNPQKAPQARIIIRQALKSQNITVSETATDQELINALVRRSSAINRSPTRETEENEFIKSLGIQ